MAHTFVGLRPLWWKLHHAAAATRFRASLWRLRVVNLASRRSVIGDTPAAVSLTSHGDRLETVFLTIESIARSRDRPQRFVLWIDDPRRLGALPGSLRRLQRRGLDIRPCANFGPHTKYFPYVQQFPQDDLPLATADDDVVYPRDWLRPLIDAHRRAPDGIHCYRARTVVLDGDGLRPYADWPLCRGTDAAPTNFLTGVSGVIYPPRFLSRLRALGPAFMALCPKADDIWLNVVALREGLAIRQLHDTAHDFPEVPGSQAQALWPGNQFSGGNDLQIQATYTPADLDRLRRPG